jgi:hypothetical protein
MYDIFYYDSSGKVIVMEGLGLRYALNLCFTAYGDARRMWLQRKDK